MDPFSEFFTKLGAGFASLTPARKTSILLATVLTLAGIGFLVYLTGQIEYRVLFSNLSSQDAGSIINKLQEKKVSYKLSATGDAVSVPMDRVAELRLEMATAGLPQGGGVGFEIFDTKSLGATEFEQQLNYRRALQGELARTISSLEEIQQSRVHLALPRESLFLEQQKKATASVTIKLKQGKSLRSSQVEGIAHLVASSVEGVSPEDVIIVDSKGNILSSVQADSKFAKMTSAQAEYQRNTEKEIGSRIQSLLENVVGKGKAVVRLSAEMDFRVSEKTEEKYDPESPVIRSVKRQTDKTALPPAAGKASPADSGGQEKLDETINYEINKVVNKTVMPVGEIQKLSVAVLIDGIYTKDAKGVEVYQPRAKKDLDSLEELVKKSAGINATRGDQVVITEMPFSRVEAATEPFEKPSWQEMLAPFSPLIKYGAVLITLIAVLMLFARPLIKGILAKDMSQSGDMLRPMTAALPLQAGVQAYQVAETNAGKELTGRDIARQLADADAKKFAEVLRTWLK